MHRFPAPPRGARSLFPDVLLSILVVAVAACSGAVSPTPVPSATGTLLPAITEAPSSGSPAPSSGSPAPSAAASPSAAAATFPLTVKDDDGTSVTVPAAPQRIVSLTPAETEILFALGDGSRVVARSEDPTPYPGAAGALPVVTKLGAVDVEKVVALSPDLVLAGGQGFTSTATITKLRSLGIPVVVVYAEDVPGVLADVRLTADVAGLPAAGDALATAMKAQLDAISAAATAAATNPPRVFYEIEYDTTPVAIYGPADSSFIAGMIALAGGTPVTTGSTTAYSIPLERLIAADPQVILLGDSAYGATVAQVKSRPGWEGMTAVKMGAIRPVDDVVVTRPGPRLAEGLRDLALAINPALSLPPLASPSAVPSSSAAP